MRALPVAALCCTAMLLAACTKPPAQAPEPILGAGRVALSGVVVDDAIRPLAGATVTATDVGVNATTDKDGLFLLAVPPGEHVLDVQHAGFGGLRQTVSVPPTGLRGLNLQLT